jgi:hypothetical protein
MLDSTPDNHNKGLYVQSISLARSRAATNCNTLGKPTEAFQHVWALIAIVRITSNVEWLPRNGSGKSREPFLVGREDSQMARWVGGTEIGIKVSHLDR